MFGKNRNELLDVQAMRSDYAASLYKDAFEAIEDLLASATPAATMVAAIQGQVNDTRMMLAND